MAEDAQERAAALPLEAAQDEDIRSALRVFKDARVVGSEDGVPYFIRGRLGRSEWTRSAMRVHGVDGPTRESLRAIAPVFRLSAEELVFKRASVDEQGHRHLRFQQLKNGLEVIGGELLLHVDPEGHIYAANGSARDGARLSAEPAVAPEAAVRAALDHTTASGATAGEDPRRVYLRVDADRQLRLAFEVRVTGEREGMPVDDLVFVDAQRGSILAVHPQVHSALNRAVYSSNNGSSLPGTIKRSEGQGATGDTHVDDNYGHLGTTYNCYKVNFNRDSYNNGGAQLKSSVHYGSNYVNAFWNGTQMVYGDGDGVNSGPLGKSLDVTVHELTHAVTDSESDLVYANEPGALNEAMSDIFAAFCEAWTKGWATDAAVWMIGDDIWTPGTPNDALRYMKNPTQDGASKDYYPERYTGTSDNGGVHWNSGIANLAFALLSDGGNHPRGKTSVTVTGIGIEKAGRIFYKANTDLFTSSTSFAQAKTYTEQAAQQLGYDTATVASVTKAWEAVGVGVAAPPPTVTPLSNGSPVSNLSDSTGGKRYYSLQVPAGVHTLTFDMSGGSGDADLYVKLGALPTTSNYDCRPYKGGNTESCAFNKPQAGTWYVMVHAYTAYSGVTLKGSYAASSGGTPVTETVLGSVTQGENKHHGPYNVVGGTTFKVVMTGSGDPDLYVKFGAAPTTTYYDCRPYVSGASETCTLTVPAGQSSAYIMVRGYNLSTYELNISYTRP